MSCLACGKHLLDEFRFCPYCGAARTIGTRSSLSDEAQTSPNRGQAAAKQKAYTVETVRATYPKAYAKWDPTEDQVLTTEFGESLDIESIAKRHGRQPGAIRARLQKLGLLPPSPTRRRLFTTPKRLGWRPRFLGSLSISSLFDWLPERALQWKETGRCSIAQQSGPLPGPTKNCSSPSWEQGSSRLRRGASSVHSTTVMCVAESGNGLFGHFLSVLKPLERKLNR